MFLLMTQTDLLRLGKNLEKDMFSLINVPLQAGCEPLQKINSNSVIWTCRVFCQI